jgi:rod shape-determining protein MreC
MRDLFRLLGRYHLLLLFLVAQGFALSWFASNHGYPRGKWVRMHLAYTGAWDDKVSSLTGLANLSAENERLAAEISDLRNRPGNQWHHAPALVIRSTIDATHNLMVLQKQDSSRWWTPDQGVLAGGFAAGRILEVEGPYALAVPLITAGMEWSGRVRRDGPVGRIRWRVGDPSRGFMSDVPSSTSVFPGDTLFTTGFQGIFPPDVPIGRVVDQKGPESDEFTTLEFAFLVDFRSLRYVDWVARPDASQIDSLLNAFNDMSWTE